MRPVVYTILVALSSFFYSCSHEDDAISESQMQAVANDALRIFVDSWNDAAIGDSVAYHQYGTLYWPDAELVDPSGQVWDGQLAIIQMHVDLWRGPFKNSHVNGSVRRVRALSPTVMIADFDFTLILSGPPLPGVAQTGPVKAHLKHIMVKRGGEWKVVAAQNTFYSAPPSAR